MIESVVAPLEKPHTRPLFAATLSRWEKLTEGRARGRESPSSILPILLGEIWSFFGLPASSQFVTMKASRRPAFGGLPIATF